MAMIIFVGLAQALEERSPCGLRAIRGWSIEFESTA